MKLFAVTIFAALCNVLTAEDMCPTWYMRKSSGLTTSGSCPSDKPEESLGLCYKKCKSGYYGTGPWCWENCKSTEENDGLWCRTKLKAKDKEVYTRKGSLPTSCPKDRVMQNGLCNAQCKKGYQLHGLINKCMKPCPKGYTDLGLKCSKAKKCCKWGICVPCGADVKGRDSYSLPKAVPPIYCPSGKEQSVGMCYSPCKSGYYGTGPVCTEKCPKGAIDRGVFCETQSFDMRLKDKYGRGMGVSKKCGPDEDYLLNIAAPPPFDVGVCFPKCRDGFTGFLNVCNYDGWARTLKDAVIITPFLTHMAVGCAFDAHVGAIMGATNLVGFDFASSGFDTCLIDNALERLGAKGWESKTGIFAMEIRLSAKVPLPWLAPYMKAAGFLGKVSNVFQNWDDYPDFDAFLESFDGFVNDATLDKMDNFLQWMWDLIVKRKDLVNGYVGIAFDSSGDGLDVYFYYGECDATNIQMGIQTVMYRSLDDIVGKMQIYAPSAVMYKYSPIGGGVLYGLAEDDCSLKYIGKSLGLGATPESAFNPEMQCTTPKMIQLVKTSSGPSHENKPKGPIKVSGCDPTCGCGYEFNSQDIKGESKEFTNPGMGIDNCARACSKRDGCTGFEYNHEGNMNYACGTYTGGGSNLAGERLNLRWTTCVVTCSVHVLSVDHLSGVNGRYFNFDKKELDAISM